MGKIQETSGVSFSLSYLIQLVTAIAVGTWGFSQLDNRIAFVENSSQTNSSYINEIQKTQEENQNSWIPADYQQFEQLKSLEKQLDGLDDELKLLSDKVYELNRLMGN